MTARQPAWRRQGGKASPDTGTIGRAERNKDVPASSHLSFSSRVLAFW